MTKWFQTYTKEFLSLSEKQKNKLPKQAGNIKKNNNHTIIDEYKQKTLEQNENFTENFSARNRIIEINQRVIRRRQIKSSQRIVITVHYALIEYRFLLITAFRLVRGR